jgi:hypothetical protein
MGVEEARFCLDQKLQPQLTLLTLLYKVGVQPPWSKLQIYNPNNDINQMGQGHLFEANLTIVAKVPRKIYGDMYASFMPQKYHKI